MNAITATTSLFDGPATTASTTSVSVRAAFQYALYGRGLIVDARPGAQRAAEGQVHPELNPVTAEELHRAAPGDHARPRRLMVIGDTEPIARAYPQAEVLGVTGGFASWLAAYLPVAG